jgi:hypothetical protein
MHVFVAVADGGELSHEDRVSVYNLLLAHQRGSEQ